MGRTTPPPAQPPAGWYPDPAAQQDPKRWRYWDGQAWRDEAASPPMSAQNAHGRRRFVRLAIASAVTCVVAFVLMQVFFSVGAIWLQVLGMVLFVVFLASGVLTIVGIIGAIVGRVSKP